MINFQEMTPATKDWMAEHGYFGGGPCYDVDKPARHGEFTFDGHTYTLVAGHYDDYWFAEIEYEDGGVDETFKSEIDPNLAIMETLCMLMAPTVFAEEGNCEDAASRLAHECFGRMFFKRPELSAWGYANGMFGMAQFALLDMCMGYARKAVKFYAADLWEEF